MVFRDCLDLPHLIARPLPQEAGLRLRRGDAVVHDPGPRLDTRASQVRLQARRFQHRRCFGQSNQHNLCLLLVLAALLVVAGCGTSSGSRDYIPGKGWVPND